MRLYGSIYLPAKEAPSRGTSFQHQNGLYDPGRINLAPFVWISDDEAAGLREHPQAPSPLLPMEDLLGAPRPPVDPADADRIRARPGFRRRPFSSGGASTPRPPPRGRLSGSGWTWPPSDRSPRPCSRTLRPTYAQMRAQLGQYLAKDALNEFEPSQGAPLRPSIQLHDATLLEIARLQGGLGANGATYVKRAYPALSDQYRELAQRTLRRAYDRGARDPRLLAIMGLCECDAGNDAAALPLLTAALRAGESRPLAAFELARIRFAQASAAPAGPAGRFSAAQVASVLEPLAAARTEAPPLPGTYALLADAWFHSAAPPTRGSGPVGRGHPPVSPPLRPGP